VAGAVADYDRAIELKPDYSLALANRGEFRRRQGDWAGALADFNRALEIEPVAIAFNNRALLMHAKGDLAAARADLDQAIKLKPDEAEFFEIAARFACSAAIWTAGWPTPNKPSDCARIGSRPAIYWRRFSAKKVTWIGRWKILAG
jgi:tetratricopeptide (TPR) repeat protein